MVDRAQLTAVLASIAIILGVIELMRRDRLREEYSILWLVLAVGIIGLSLSRTTLDWLAHLVGIFYPPSALFAAAFIGCLALFMHFSIVISHLTQQNIVLAQELALMRMENGGAELPEAQLSDRVRPLRAHRARPVAHTSQADDETPHQTP